MYSYIIILQTISLITSQIVTTYGHYIIKYFKSSDSFCLEEPIESYSFPVMFATLTKFPVVLSKKFFRKAKRTRVFDNGGGILYDGTDFRSAGGRGVVSSAPVERASGSPEKTGGAASGGVAEWPKAAVC